MAKNVSPVSDLTLTRVENLHVILKLDKEQFDKVQDLVKIILGREPPVVFDGDTLTVSYDFYAAYLGEIETKMNAILSLLTNAPDVVQADSNLIDGVSCLFARLIDKLHQINALCKERNK